MRLTPALRQQGQYLFLLLVCAVAAHLAYQTLHADRVLFREAEASLVAGHDQQARRLFRQALDHGLDWPPALIRTVEAALETGDQITAAQALENFRSSVGSPRPEQLLELAGLLDRFGQPEQARDIMAAYPRIVTSSPDVAMYLAGLCRRTGDWDQAEALYTRLAGIPALRLRADLERAEMYAWQGRYSEAETLLRQVLTAQPDLRPARLTLARVLSWGGRFQEAITEYKNALGEPI
ncbi:MAG: tetratricopeptide repeat protein [Deltaproteobacteria bacterium]|nr:tetratricopeptide repeat protein [Deltaproteobacteria bacterium]